MTYRELKKHFLALIDQVPHSDMDHTIAYEDYLALQELFEKTNQY